MKFSDIKLGDYVQVIGEVFPCLKPGEVKEVKQHTYTGDLYVDCKVGEHTLEPMVDAHGDIPSLKLFESNSDDAVRESNSAETDPQT